MEIGLSAILQRGHWQDRQLIPAAWIDAMLTPSPIKRDYGYLWWLNTGHAFTEAASRASVFAMGAGGNLIWIAPEREQVAVIRWLDPAARRRCPPGSRPSRWDHRRR